MPVYSGSCLLSDTDASSGSIWGQRDENHQVGESRKSVAQIVKPLWVSNTSLAAKNKQGICGVIFAAFVELDD